MTPKWQRRFLQLAHEVASWSKDTTQVGAVIVDQNRNPRGFGYNGMPRGLDDGVCERSQAPLKNWLFEHAERNVIYSASRIGIPIEGCVIFATHFPCVDCARAIVQSGLKCVVVDAACMDPQREFHIKWKDQIAVSRMMFEETGVEVILVDCDVN